MSLHFILDGYNIIKRSDFLSTKVLKDARCDLIRFITEKKPCGSTNNKVSVVFDGVSNDFNFSQADNNERIKVLFTYNSSADSKIKNMVGESKNPKRIVVVSDDREIQFFIKSCGARSMSVADFILKGLPTPKPSEDPPKMELSYSQVAKINKELAKVWLNSHK